MVFPLQQTKRAVMGRQFIKIERYKRNDGDKRKNKQPGAEIRENTRRFSGYQKMDT